MDYGQISLPKGTRPRMELYDPRTLSKQVLAETIGLRGQTPRRMFGNGKVSSPFPLVPCLKLSQGNLLTRFNLMQHANIYSPTPFAAEIRQRGCVQEGFDNSANYQSLRLYPKEPIEKSSSRHQPT
jgi:hypothetical protein